MKRIHCDDLAVRAISAACRHGSVPLAVARSLCASTSESLRALPSVVVHFSGLQTPRTTASLARLEPSTLVIRQDYSAMQNEANPAANAERVIIHGPLDLYGRLGSLRVVRLCRLDTTADVLRRFCAALPALDAFDVATVLSPRELFTPRKATRCAIDNVHERDIKRYAIDFGRYIEDVSLSCIDLAANPAFPETLERLSLYRVRCADDELVVIPEGISSARIDCCHVNLLRLPSTLTELEYVEEDAYTRLPDRFPSRMRKLHLCSWQMKLEPSSLPDTLLDLSIQVEGNLRGIRLPASLEVLSGPLDDIDFSALPRLRELSGYIWHDTHLMRSLPPSIERVDITYQPAVDTTADLAACTKLTRFELCAKNATVIVTGCGNLLSAEVSVHKCIFNIR